MNQPILEQQTAEPVKKLPVTQLGGRVNAVVPQSVDDIWRVANMVSAAGLAPQALIEGKQANEAVSAIAIAIMSGAELGLPPMVALRSFTVINGRPALWGDGLLAVVRASGKAKIIESGVRGDEENPEGYCISVRADTGERRESTFSKADAVKADLWISGNSPKPWAKYPKRMLERRAIGMCLRDLYADVLGGIRDEYEAADMPPENASYEPVQAAPTPPNPDDFLPAEQVQEAEVVEEAEAEEVEPDYPDDFSLGEYMENLEAAMEGCKSSLEVGAEWSDFDPEGTLKPDDLETAKAIRQRKLDTFTDQAE